MSLPDQIDHFFRRFGLNPHRLLVAVSAGPDSTALLAAMCESKAAGFEVVAVHVNHRLRDEASQEDARWIAACSKSLGVEHHELEGVPDARELARVGIEAAARKIRYELLERMRIQLDADYVATAHHEDDEAETVLLRLITGSGPQRLNGIAPVDELRRLIRPFLFTRRRDIEAFLGERGIEARKDESNENARFVRNRIRHELLPLLGSMNPRIVETLAETAAQGRELREALDWAVDLASTRYLRRSEDQSVIERDEKLTGWILRAILLREILRLDPESRDVNADDLRRLEEGSESRVSVTPTLELIRKPHAIRLQRRIETGDTPAFAVAFEGGSGAQVAAAGTLVDLLVAGRDDEPQSDSFQLDEASAENFLLRNRRDGDRFQPFGFPHHKKLKEVLINRKIESSRRDRLLIITHDETLVWVSEVGVSEKFRVKDRNRKWFRVFVREKGEASR